MQKIDKAQVLWTPINQLSRKTIGCFIIFLALVSRDYFTARLSGTKHVRLYYGIIDTAAAAVRRRRKRCWMLTIGNMWTLFHMPFTAKESTRLFMSAESSFYEFHIWCPCQCRTIVSSNFENRKDFSCRHIYVCDLQICDLGHQRAAPPKKHPIGKSQ